MPRLRTRPGPTAALLAVALVAAACSGDDDDAAATTAAPSDASTSSPAGADTAARSTDPVATATTVALTPSGEQCGLFALDTAGETTLGSLVASTPELST